MLINISMHECRDIERVTERVHRALRPGGRFVISDFPFPESTAGLRTVPGRIMSGIQFLDALIDDQLLPTSAYLDLLQRHGFRAVDAFDITPRTRRHPRAEVSRRRPGASGQEPLATGHWLLAILEFWRDPPWVARLTPKGARTKKRLSFVLVQLLAALVSVAPAA